MKRFRYSLAPVAVFLMFCASVRAEEKIRIGVTRGGQHDTIVDVLNRQPSVHAEIVDAVSAAALQSLDVLIVTHSENPALLNRSLLAMRKAVQSGKGALFLHDAVGYGTHIPVFREIGNGTHAPLRQRFKVVADHPVTAGIVADTFHDQGFQYDHVALEAGPHGVVLAVNDDAEAVVIAGEYGEGRVVLIGMAVGGSLRIPGPIEDDRTGRGGISQDPEGAERHLFLNAIRWLGARD